MVSFIVVIAVVLVGILVISQFASTGSSILWQQEIVKSKYGYSGAPNQTTLQTVFWNLGNTTLNVMGLFQVTPIIIIFGVILGLLGTMGAYGYLKR